jgi:hypothetical protein
MTEKLRVPPPGHRYELHCGDCISTVTLFTDVPECVEAGFGVAHSPDCPWLGARLVIQEPRREP